MKDIKLVTELVQEITEKNVDFSKANKKNSNKYHKIYTWPLVRVLSPYILAVILYCRILF